jgi:hypothetical protein
LLPKANFPGETVIKLYYCKRLDGYVTIPGISLFRVAEDSYKLEAISDKGTRSILTLLAL